MSTSCTERGADTQFASSPSDHVGSDRVDSHSRKQQRQRREPDKVTQDETTVGDCILQRLPQARDLRNGQCRVDRTDQRHNGVRDGAYAKAAAHHHHHWTHSRLPKQRSRRHVGFEASEKAPLIASLRERLVILGADLIVSRKAPDVADHADDRLPGK